MKKLMQIIKYQKALKSVFALSEAYPELSSNENFLKLQERISGLENEISDRRELYNESVNNYNIRIQSIPDTFCRKRIESKRRRNVQSR